MIISPEQKRWDEEAKKNADIIASKINEIDTVLSSATENISIQLAELSKDVLNMFRDLKPLRKNDIRNLNIAFNKERDKMKDYLSQFPDEREESSKAEQSTFIDRINEIKEMPVRELNREDADVIQQKLKSVIADLQKKSEVMLGNHVHTLWTAIKDAKKKVQTIVSELQKAEFEKALASLNEAKELLEAQMNPFDMANKIKELRSGTKGLYLNKNQTNHLKKEFDAAWAKLSQKIEVFKEEKKRKQEEWHKRKEKHEEWLSKQKDRLEFLEKRTARLAELIGSIENEIVDLEEKRDTARTPEFAEKCQKWIEEKINKLNEFEKTHKELSDVIEQINKQ